MTRREISPALMGSVALHLAVAAALLISWRFTRDLKIGAVVPVTLVTDAPAADLRAAVEAPESQAARAEQPTPQAQPAPLPPAPQPAVQPPAPQPAPAKAAKPQPAAKPDKALDLDALAASLSKISKPAGGKASSAAKGPARAETAPQARPDLGASAASSAALNGLIDDLQRRWNPNCEVQGGRDVMVRATFLVGSGGQLMSDVQAEVSGPRTPVANAAAMRAVSAVQAAAPFRSLPREYYGQRISVNFNAREACS